MPLALAHNEIFHTSDVQDLFLLGSTLSLLIREYVAGSTMKYSKLNDPRFYVRLATAERYLTIILFSFFNIS